tara:strand:+ start:311 stop:487 length:177 start_codon:yes stop_codon:yes gene_type:complete
MWLDSMIHMVEHVEKNGAAAASLSPLLTEDKNEDGEEGTMKKVAKFLSSSRLKGEETL